MNRSNKSERRCQNYNHRKNHKATLVLKRRTHIPNASSSGAHIRGRLEEPSSGTKPFVELTHHHKSMRARFKQRSLIWKQIWLRRC